MGFFSWLQIKSSENALDIGSILFACHMLFSSFFVFISQIFPVKILSIFEGLFA